MTNTTTDMTIEQQLRGTWKQQRRFCHVRGLSRCVIWLVMLLLLGLLIDWGLLFKTRMPAILTLLLSVGGLVTMVWVVWRDWLRHLQPYDATSIAMEVENKHPELMSSLVSYTEMDHFGERAAASAELLSAMRDFAITQSQQLKFSDIIDFSQLKKLGVYAAVVLVVATSLSFVWSDHFSAFVNRLVGIDTTYPIRTQLVDITGDMLVPFGETTSIDVRAGGVIPDDAILHMKAIATKSDNNNGENDSGSAGDWSEVPMDKRSNGASFRRQLDGLDRDMEYFVTMGDYRSESYRITVVRAPRIVKAELKLHFPEYLGRPVETTDQLNLEVPEGTRIEWRLQCDKAVGKLGVIHGDQRIDIDAGETNRDVSFALTADHNFNYTFEWTEGDSGKRFQFKDVEYSIKTIVDAKPRIAFTSKPPKGPATLSKKTEIAWTARDDYGLGKIWLVYTVTTPDQSQTPKEQRILLREAGGKLSDNQTRSWEPAKHIAGLAPGKQIKFFLETADLKPSDKGERIVRSRVHQFSIVSVKDYTAWALRQLGERNNAIKAVFGNQLSASEQIKELLKKQGDSKP
jgi:hypothetical protein